MSVLNGRKKQIMMSLRSKRRPCVELNQSRREAFWFLTQGVAIIYVQTSSGSWILMKNSDNLVKLGINSKMAMLGKGNIRLLINGITQVITDVFYIPELENNLLSIRQLHKKGVAFFIQHGYVESIISR